MDIGLGLLAWLSLIPPLVSAEPSAAAASPYARWSRGPGPDPSFFPIAVWLQDPANAKAYREAGINTFVGLWKGPTEEQLTKLKAAGMRLICSQNEVALRHLEDPAIMGWMHGDEPDNAQALPGDRGYGPPILPERIIRDYERLRTKDPSRPVLLNLGQGVAWDNYIGRGVRRNHPEDYVEYVKGCDIASFDIYPAVHDSPEVAGKLWFVADGVARLAKWAGPERVVWNCLECTRISNPNTKPTPQQVRAEAWMSLIHGSRGLIYFVHQFKPTFREAALLDDPEMLTAVGRLNREISSLAPVLHSPPQRDRGTVTTTPGDRPVAMTVRKHDGRYYVFAVGMRDGEASAVFTLSDIKGERRVQVLGEGRELSLQAGRFTDRFAAWSVHLYRFDE